MLTIFNKTIARKSKKFCSWSFLRFLGRDIGGAARGGQRLLKDVLLSMLTLNELSCKVVEEGFVLRLDVDLLYLLQASLCDDFSYLCLKLTCWARL